MPTDPLRDALRRAAAGDPAAEREFLRLRALAVHARQEFRRTAHRNALRMIRNQKDIR